MLMSDDTAPAATRGRRSRPRGPRSAGDVSGRLILAGIVLLVAVGLAAVLLLTGHDSNTSRRAPSAAARLVPKFQQGFADRRLRVRGGLPKGWASRTTPHTLRLASTDRTSLIVVSSPGPARDVRRIYRAALETVKADYRDIRVLSSAGRSVAGRPAASIVVTGVNKAKVPLRILVAAVRGVKTTYLVELFSASTAPAARLVEAQVILTTLKLAG